MSLCLALFCAVPLLLMAEGDSLEEQVAAVKGDITVAQQINIELKAQLAAKETEAAELKVKLKQIEDQIDALYIKHHMESK
jgi:septal ring factor EnvC (AmiA/AmiB activator)